jgi:hypothetical protein
MVGGRTGWRDVRGRQRHALAWFALALLAVDLAVATQARRWEAFDPHPYRERIARCQEYRPDLLIVGGSPAMCGIDPAGLVGLSWADNRLDTPFNLGLPLATTAEVCLAAEHGSPVPPRLIVYGVSATDLNDARLEGCGPRHLMTAGDLVRWSADWPKLAPWYLRQYGTERGARLWQPYYHSRGLRRWAADAIERAYPGSCPDAAARAACYFAVSTNLRTGDGFIRHTSPVLPETFEQLKAAGRAATGHPFLEDYHLGYQLAAVHRLLDRSAHNGIPTVLVDLPVPADLDEQRYPQAYALYRAALARTAADHEVPLLSATRAAVGITDADFSDVIHLNDAGAAKLTAWIRQSLTAISPPPSARNPATH